MDKHGDSFLSLSYRESHEEQTMEISTPPRGKDSKRLSIL